ncbi:hypothetical protein [Eupransor demetentiae]|uniref:Lipoprotein n=1 Tax=Eupransor demetentiae TaxID=3109584 RepID=A0ABM9N596_9LACO|nr:hypothetical protein R54876_GBNLAHCA_00926 [Lactobacillaceae bacterium LMG 33000]
MKKYIAITVAIIVIALGAFGLSQKQSSKSKSTSSSQRLSHTKSSASSSKASSSSQATSSTSKPSDSSSTSSSTTASVNISNNDQAADYLKQKLGYQNDNNIEAGVTTGQDQNGNYYLIQLKSISSVVQNGAGGTIGYYKLYQNGQWQQVG